METKFCLSTLIMLMFSFYVISQTSKDKYQNNDDVYPDTSKKSINSGVEKSNHKPLQLIDGQILGPGLFISVNYDTRFKPENKGLGLRAGLGGALLGLTIPLSVNYLIGNNNKRSFLEIGAGVTLFVYTASDWNQFQQTTLLPNTYIMYRYQALKSPNTFRIGLSQIRIFEDSGFVPYYPSLSLGHILGRRK